MLILLPVGGLALFGLFSLRQDRILAQQEAKDLGKSIAQRLAQAISDDAAEQLRDYRNANFELDANRTSDLGFSQWAWVNGVTADTVRQHLETWQRNNPGIDLAQMPTCDCWLSLQPERLSPKLYPEVPQPPEWVHELTPEQSRLWQSAKELEFNSTDPAATESAIEKFIASKPAKGAVANAELLRLFASTRGTSRVEAASVFARSNWRMSDQLTDAGLPVGQLICYQALRRLPDGAGLSSNLTVSVPWAITYRPSVFSPVVISEAERVARGSQSAAKVATLKAWWESDEKARRILRAFEEQHPTNEWSASLFGVVTDDGKFLLALGDEISAGTNTFESAEKQRQVLIFPQAVVDRAIDRAIARSGVSVPPYAMAEWEIAGKRWELPERQTIVATNAVSVLGEAETSLQHLPFVSAAYPFRVRVLLTHPDILYARQRQRTWLFGALIVASTLAALIGLVAAYQSFHREQQLNQMKSNFVSSVSHELRAPIASVRLLAESLEKGTVQETEKQREYFRFIGQESRRLSALIANVLDFSRIEQGRKQYEFEPTDVAALVRDTVRLMEPYGAEKEVRLEISNFEPPTSNIELSVDGRAIQQALVNLIDNAIKHSPKGETVKVGVELRNAAGNGRSDAEETLHDPTHDLSGSRREEAHFVSLKGDQSLRTSAATNQSSGAQNNPRNYSPDPRSSTLDLFVADRGPGIPPAEQGKIFERFYRLGSELRRETQGVGIGLSIVQHIVEAHGGQVRVESTLGKGSRFTIELPMRANHE